MMKLSSLLRKKLSSGKMRLYFCKKNRIFVVCIAAMQTTTSFAATALIHIALPHVKELTFDKKNTQRK
ncbi:MAG: hypothetical protein IKQ94_04145 [Bacteroidales bacterium]|nr:hypothetical protein [Bacteroidales bacterium]